MNSVQNEKYGVSPNETENKSLTSERFRTLTEQKKQKCFTIDLIGMIRKNKRQKQENWEKN